MSLQIHARSESWSDITSSATKVYSPAAKIDVSVRPVHQQSYEIANPSLVSKGNVASGSVISLALYQSADVMPERACSAGSLLKKWEAAGRGEVIRQGRARLASRVQQSEGLTLRAMRVGRNMSQSEVAEEVGTSQPHIARLEAGRVDPGRSMMRRLASLFGVDMNAIDSALELRSKK